MLHKILIGALLASKAIFRHLKISAVKTFIDDYAQGSRKNKSIKMSILDFNFFIQFEDEEEYFKLFEREDIRQIRQNLFCVSV